MSEIQTDIINNEFLSSADIALSEEFMSQGYSIVSIEDVPGLERIRSSIVKSCVRYLKCDDPQDTGMFLNKINNQLDVSRLNHFRLNAIDKINSKEWFRPTYYKLARSSLETLVGNELSMQRRINMSIQFPGDDSSLLPIHCDVWSGDSPFEVVLWIPLVDCFGTKSMFIVPPKINAQIQERWHEFNGRSSDALFEAVENDLIWVDIPFGKALIFNQNLMHGNRINNEQETRWTLNCRFKGAFTPYADKRIGEFFEPITLRAASRIGLCYNLPNEKKSK